MPQRGQKRQGRYFPRRKRARAAIKRDPDADRSETGGRWGSLRALWAEGALDTIPRWLAERQRGEAGRKRRRQLGLQPFFDL